MRDRPKFRALGGPGSAAQHAKRRAAPRPGRGLIITSKQSAGEHHMKVGFVGCGEMGEPMAGHVLKTGKFEVFVFDIRKAATKGVAKKGAKIASSLEELGRTCDLFIVMVGYDHQVKQVVTDLAKVGKKGAVIVITATSHPDMILNAQRSPASAAWAWSMRRSATGSKAPATGRSPLSSAAA